MKTSLSFKSYWLSASFIFLSVALLHQVPFAQPKNNGQQQIKSASDLEVIRQRVTDDLLEPPVNASHIEKLVATIKPDGSWPGINYIDTSRTGFQHKDHLENMLDLARAYKKPGSPLINNAAVKQTLWLALNFWIANDFISANWWWNEMGTPNWMINTLLVMDEDLTETQKKAGLQIAGRASFTGFGARAGGDFVPIAGMVCKQALFKKDEAMLSNALKVMGDQVVITADRGINPDMGFHHRTDHVTSIHTYGTNYVSSFTYWTVKTAGTKFQLSDASVKLLADYYLEGITKSMAYGRYPDPGAKNRDLSRKDVSRPAGTDIPENFLLSTSYRKKEMEDLVKIRKGLLAPTLTWDKYFWHSSYFVHQRQNYFASVRMHSSRQSNVEEPHNEEGLRMHHLADGANFLMVTVHEYDNIYPVMDWQKIPGATIVQKPELPPSKQIAKKGKSDFVGAVSDGDYGAAAFDFKSVHDPLTARKAWFFFDKEYVCLGAGIHSTAGYPVATTLNQTLLNGQVSVKSGTGTTTLKKGLHELAGVSWVHHNRVGYVFHTPITINLNNSTATGNYRQINHQEWATEEPVNKDLFVLWLNHGQQPDSASYAYTVLPGIDATAMRTSQHLSSTTILQNTPQLQAVQNGSMQLTQVVFYAPGTLKLNATTQLSANDACIIMVKMNGKSVERITVADPTQKLKTITLKINAPVPATGKNWNAGSKWSTIEIALPESEMAGQSVVLNMTEK